MKQRDFYQALYQTLQGGGRGLTVPQPPLAKLARTLSSSRRALVLTGFPIDCGDYVIGETDGPCGAAEIARVLTALGCQVTVVTDAPSIPLLRAALAQTAPAARLEEAPMEDTEAFARTLWEQLQPDLFLSIERPGKASNGHFHNMRGTVIDAMTADTDCLLALAAERGCVTVAIGDGGNELGMGALLPQIAAGVPHGAVHVRRGGIQLVGAWAGGAAVPRDRTKPDADPRGGPGAAPGCSERGRSGRLHQGAGAVGGQLSCFGPAGPAAAAGGAVRVVSGGVLPPPSKI